MGESGQLPAAAGVAGSEGGDAGAALTRAAYAGRLFPDRQLELFRNRGWLFAQREIARGKNVLPLPRAPAQLNDVRIKSIVGGDADVVDYVSRNRVAGLLVLQHGKVVLEHYEFGNDAATPWISMSVAKAISSTLVGAAIHDKLIRSIDDPLQRYLPKLAGTAYDGVSIRQLLQMTSGLSWDETHTITASERRQMLELQIKQKPGEILRYLAGRERVAPPGSQWIYGTGDAHIVGELLHAVTGDWVSHYLSAKLWSVIGMEYTAHWWLESPGGLEVAGSGINATLRDYGRFGQFILNDGVAGTQRILPEGWVKEAGTSKQVGGKRVDYGYMWWPVPAPGGSLADGAFSARGIFGQFLYINPAHGIVVVVLSARSKPKFSEAILDVDFFNGVVEALR